MTREVVLLVPLALPLPLRTRGLPPGRKGRSPSVLLLPRLLAPQAARDSSSAAPRLPNKASAQPRSGCRRGAPSSRRLPEERVMLLCSGTSRAAPGVDVHGPQGSAPLPKPRSSCSCCCRAPGAPVANSDREKGERASCQREWSSSAGKERGGAVTETPLTMGTATDPKKEKGGKEEKKGEEDGAPRAVGGGREGGGEERRGEEEEERRGEEEEEGGAKGQREGGEAKGLGPRGGAGARAWGCRSGVCSRPRSPPHPESSVALRPAPGSQRRGSRRRCCCRRRCRSR